MIIFDEVYKEYNFKILLDRAVSEVYLLSAIRKIQNFIYQIYLLMKFGVNLLLDKKELWGIYLIMK